MSTEAFNVQALIFVVILVIYVLTSQIIENKKVPFIHESTIAILMGVLTAIIAKYVITFFNKFLQKEISFEGDLFFAIILPPMIFSAGYSLRKALFFDNFGMIGFLGIIGTAIGFLLLSGFIFFLNKVLFNVLTLTEILVLSSVLCATDTVAALSLVKAQQYPALNAVLFGESMLNDAVAIILFGTIQKLKLDESGQEFSFKVVENMFFNFCYLLFFSVFFGTISGFGLSYLFKNYQSINKHPIKETSLILLNGYLTYLIGQLIGLSGIITLFTCAIIMGHYSFMNISEESQKGTGLAFQTVSYIAQAFVFTYLGASTLSIDADWRAAVMSVLILLGLPFVRAAIVMVIPLVYKVLGRDCIVNNKELKLIWFSGLIRGVIAFALCLRIDSSHRKFISTIALVIVMVTTLLGSSMLKTFSRFIGMEQVNQANENQGEEGVHQLRSTDRSTDRKDEHFISSNRDLHLKEKQDHEEQVENYEIEQKQNKDSMLVSDE